jgi:hypothetical protein
MSENELDQQLIKTLGPMSAFSSAEGFVENVNSHIWAPQWPEFDFRRLPLCQASRNQLANIYEYVCAKGTPPEHRSQLLNFIVQRAFVPDRGIYLPVSPHFFLTGKSPEFSERLKRNTISFATHHDALQFFTNPLLIPQGWGTTQFDAESAVAPNLRATNGEFLFVTMEIDCQSRDDFEENLRWTRCKGEDFNQAPFAAVDRKLCQFKDYRGYSIVLSGNKSLHFHFVFSTKHLENCPEKTVGEELGV